MMKPLLLKADALHKLGKLDECKAVYEIVLLVDPDNEKARRSVEKFSGVAMEKRVRGGVKNGISSTGQIRKEVEREIKMEAVVEAGDSGKVKVTVADMERDERIWRHDSFEENSTLSGQPEQTDVVTKCRQPLLLHRPPRLFVLSECS